MGRCNKLSLEMYLVTADSPIAGSGGRDGAGGRRDEKRRREDRSATRGIPPTVSIPWRSTNSWRSSLEQRAIRDIDLNHVCRERDVDGVQVACFPIPGGTTGLRRLTSDWPLDTDDDLVEVERGDRW